VKGEVPVGVSDEGHHPPEKISPDRGIARAGARVPRDPAVGAVHVERAGVIEYEAEPVPEGKRADREIAIYDLRPDLLCVFRRDWARIDLEMPVARHAFCRLELR
jgi:hypothetical protein